MSEQSEWLKKMYIQYHNKVSNVNMLFIIVINLDIEISNFSKKAQKPYIHTYLRKETKINNDDFI